MTTNSGYPEPDQMFGPYRIVRRLGGGGMGVVFEAVDTTLRRPVALKVISRELDGDETFRARFRAEAQGQASLDSPHVVSVFAHGEVDGRPYIVTQLVPGGDLGQMIAVNGPPPLRIGLAIIAQIADGLADAHAAGVIHRDLKPANVLLRRRGEEMHAYLADFGIARQVTGDQGLTTVGGTIGTPRFMAPELHLGGKAGPASDIYSLGCLLWATLTGAPPYAGGSDYELVRAHIEQPTPQFAAGGPEADQINRILRIAMAKLPEDRYPNAAAMKADLHSALRLVGSASQLRPATQAAAPVSTPPRGGRGLFVAVLALLGIVGLALLGYVLVDAYVGRTEPARSEAADGPETITSAELITNAERRKAQESLAQAVQGTVGSGLVTRGQADCVAEKWIGGIGLSRMVDQGFFDDDFNFIDLGEDEMTPRSRAAALEAVAVCTST